MQAIAEIQVVPVGTGVSVRNEVERAHELIQAAGLKSDLHASGTNVEGGLDQILSAVRNIHERLHADGTPRLLTTIKIDTRTDKPETLEEMETAANRQPVDSPVFPNP